MRKTKNHSSTAESGKTARCALLFYFNWLDHIEHLPRQQQAEVVMALIQYARTRQQPSQLSEAGWVAFRFAAHIVDHDRQRYRLYDPEAEAMEQQNATTAPKTNRRTEPAKETESKTLQIAKSKALAEETTNCTVAKLSPCDAELQNTENQKIAEQVLPIIKNKEQKTDNTSSFLATEGKEEEGRKRESCAFRVSRERAQQGEARQGAEDKAQQANDETLQNLGAAAQATPSHNQSEEESVQPPTLEEVQAYWKDERMESVAEEFFAYYDERHWQTFRGQAVRRWRTAARNWERYFQTNVKVRRQLAAQQAEVQRLNLEHQRTIDQERQREREARERQQAETQRRACTHEEARALFALALQACAGEQERAIAMMKDEVLLQQLRARLHAQKMAAEG